MTFFIRDLLTKKRHGNHFFSKSEDQLIKYLDKYIKKGKLGEGTYGEVYKAENSQTGEVSIIF